MLRVSFTYFRWICSHLLQRFSIGSYLYRSENLLKFSSLDKNDIPKVSHYNTFLLSEICMPETTKLFVYKHTEAIEYVKN